MNILQQEDIIKGLPDQALQEEAKKPSGQVPQFLVVSEIQRRTDMRKKYQDPNKEQPQGTIADQITQEGIASVQPQQPMQGEQQQGQPMPMRGGGMTPFMAKYANGGRAEGYLPNLMATPLDQYAMNEIGFDNKISELFNSGLSLDQIKSVVGKQFGSEAVNRVDQLANPDLLSQQVEDDYDLYSRNNPSMPVPPMPVENVTDPRLLTLNGVNTLTPDGQRPYPPDTPSVDTLEQFSNAFKEDAERANNLLATLNNATPEEEEAISNPVSVNLPEIRTLEEIGKDAPQMLPLSKRKAPPSLDELVAKVETDKFSKKFPSMDEGALIGQEIGNVVSGIDSSVKKGILDVGEYVTGDLADSLTAGDFSSPYEAGRTISASATQPISFLADKLGDGYQGAYNLTAGMLEPIENLGRGLVSADERQGKGFRYDTPRGLFQQDDSGKSFYFGGSGSSSAEDLINIAEEQNAYLENLGKRNLDVAKIIEEKRKKDASDNTVISDGATSEGSGDIGVNNSNKAVNLLNNAFELDLDATKKEAFAMAMIQLGAGIAKGDLAEGLSNAGVAASGVMDKSRDRAGKQLDREILQKHYDAKLSEAQELKDFKYAQAVESAYSDWLEANYDATDQEKIDKRKELRKNLGLLGDTITTGSSIGGGNQRSSANIDFNSLNT